MERLKTALKISSNKKLAEAMGIKPNAFYNRKSANSIPFEAVIGLCITRNVSIDWVLCGEGQPFRDLDKWVAPVVEIDSILLAEICKELEAAYCPNVGPAKRSSIFNAAKRGGLAAVIFNRVATIPGAALRSASIRDQALGFAEAEQFMAAEQPSEYKIPPDDE